MSTGAETASEPDEQSPEAELRDQIHEYESEVEDLQAEKDAIEQRIEEINEKIEDRREELEALRVDSTDWFDFPDRDRQSLVRKTIDRLADDREGAGVSISAVSAYLGEGYGAPESDVEDCIDDLLRTGTIYETGEECVRVLE